MIMITREQRKNNNGQGKVREFRTDWISKGKSHRILENSGNLRQMLFVIF